MAFQEYRGVDEFGNQIRVWSFKNFADIFTEFTSPKSELRISLFNTFKYFVKDMLMIPLTVLLSYTLYKKVYGYKILRVIIYLPSIIPGVVYVTVFKSMIAPFGAVAEVLDKLFGYELPALLSDPKTATWTIVFYTIWTGFGTNMILYQGAMNRIPEEILESATLDGVSAMRELGAIIIPLIWPTISMTIVLLFTALFTASGPILLFSEAGMNFGGYETSTISFCIFNKTYLGSTYEYPAAIGVFFTVCSLPITFGIRAIMNKLDPEVSY